MMQNQGSKDVQRRPANKQSKSSGRRLLTMIPTQAKPGETPEQAARRVVENLKQALARQK